MHSRNGYFQYLLCSKGRNSKSRLTRVTFFFLFCFLHIVSWGFIFVRNFISQMVFNLQSRYKYMVEMTMFNVQMAITPKVCKSELQFICSASSLIVHLHQAYLYLVQSSMKIQSGHEFTVESAFFSISTMLKGLQLQKKVNQSYVF